MNRCAIAVATWFGCGYFPWGPGTVGSIAGALIAYFLTQHFGWGHLGIALLTVALLPIGIWSATRTAQILQRKDPGLVVVDEVLGVWVTLLGATVFTAKSILIGLVLFRIFDIWKPWPVRSFEKLPEGTGIVMDDIAAGVYGALILYVVGVFKVY